MNGPRSNQVLTHPDGSAGDAFHRSAACNMASVLLTFEKSMCCLIIAAFSCPLRNFK